jgi:hypothetical protein
MGNLMFTTNTQGNPITNWVAVTGDAKNGYILSIDEDQANGAYWSIDAKTRVLYTVIEGKNFAIYSKVSDVAPAVIPYDSTNPQNFCILSSTRDNVSGDNFNIIFGNEQCLLHQKIKYQDRFCIIALTPKTK